ncbi:transposase family protein [Caldifermentibacillus hisashii]|uniref:transposase family protein n=1 Tax=Caldifermentibacillus hisashii TaxID=996558 RepID=UPI0034D54D1B
MALNLGSGWKVDYVEFNPDEKKLHIFISTVKGSTFECPTCGNQAPIYDHGRERIWRHLNFFQFETYIHGRLPRTYCSQCNGSPKTIRPNWARERSGFSVYFEAFVILLMKAMPVKKVANLINEHDTTLWPILHHSVEEARERKIFLLYNMLVLMKHQEEKATSMSLFSWILKNVKLFLLQKAKINIL